MQLGKAPLDNLNTIRVEFIWGRRGISKPGSHFINPKDIGPIHERAAKKGHAGSAGLGKTVTAPPVYQAKFDPEPNIKPRTFIFRYGSQGMWLAV
jgi:hypothetical protein